MKIVGGIYGERCARPLWDRVFGSGGRAAVALATICPGIELYGYASPQRQESLELSFGAMGITTHLTSISDNITFDYLHPLSRPSIIPEKVSDQNPIIEVAGNTVLRFGMIEGDAKVTASRAIYDPQTGDIPVPFCANGSECKTLAVVLNENEALKVGGTTALEAANEIRQNWRAQVVVVKLGTRGALVVDGNSEPVEISPYESERIFKVGSGDIFSAVFAYCWGVEQLGAAEAAEIASRAVAEYVETRSLPLVSLPKKAVRQRIEPKERGQIYLAGPFFDVSQRWLINESLMILEILGALVFSPIHDVGPSETVGEVAEADLTGLDNSSVVLAFVDTRDPGTLLEVGYAIKANKKVVILAERIPEHELTMFSVPNCIVTKDFSTALYKAVWLS